MALKYSEKVFVFLVERIVFFIFLGLIPILCQHSMASHGGYDEPDDRPSAIKILKLLKNGNERFVAEKPKHPNSNKSRREETELGGQKPLATVLSCSDSRQVPEFIFDRGIGELFVVRVAGNVADDDEIATIEYGVEHLGTPLLLVLGHSKCGAVTAVARGDRPGGYLPKLLDNIFPAVEKTTVDHPGMSGDAFLVKAIKNNIWQSVGDILTKSVAVRELARIKKVLVHGAYYDLHTGKVEWMGSHPDHAKMVGLTENE